jgi:hypothetical protein
MKTESGFVNHIKDNNSDTVVDILKSNNLKINLDFLNKLKNAIKNDFEKIDEVSDILEKFPFLKNDIKNRLDNGILFQPGRIVETIVIQSIADYLKCAYIGDGIYENDYYLIKQDGGSGKSDLIIVDKLKDKLYVLEIKEPAAYGKSCGFTYDDDGKPVDFTSKDQKYKEYVKSLFDNGNLLDSYNILENIGHNKVFEISDIITNEFDFIISYDDYGTLIIMTIDEYKDNFNFRIEVRSCGRNRRKVFTKNKLNLVGDILFLEKSEISDITQRGGKTSRRCKYIHNNATFSFERKDLKEENGKLHIHFDKIKQYVGEVSIQHFIKKV